MTTPSRESQTSPCVTFVARFRRRHGRPPRILHVGNIANNAYLNAKILNRAGFDCDVLSHDYYHIMGCPEWEDADIDGDVGDPAFPNWAAVDLKGFERPRWFAQGSERVCLAYLLARRRRNRAEADRLWRKMGRQRRSKRAYLWQVLMKTARFVGGRALLDGAARVLRRMQQSPTAAGVLNFARRMRLRDAGIVLGALAALFGYRAGAAVVLALCAGSYLPRFARYAAARAWDWRTDRTGRAFATRVQELARDFAEAFPDRPDALVSSDLDSFGATWTRWQALLECYDVVVGYATHGIYPLLADKRPYLAYEHGTIRRIPFEPTPQGRRCALAYRSADLTIITNCDNAESAEALGVPTYRFIPHPVNEGVEEVEASAALGERLRATLDAEFLLFHPSRQHWEPERHPSWEKGNDILIRGFARFVQEVCPAAGAVFVEWGRTVRASKRLLASLGVADRVLWVPPMPNRAMIKHIQACDLLADQFFLGAFGSTTPKALRHGSPAMLYLDESRHQWCFPKMPPVVNASTSEEVFEGLRRVYADPAYRKRLIEQGRAWYHRYHSAAVITERFTEAIAAVLAEDLPVAAHG